MDLDQGSDMIILASYFNIFVLSFNFWGNWGVIKNWLELEPESLLQYLIKLSLPESVKHTVDRTYTRTHT
jgi:hypothetical protein